MTFKWKNSLKCHKEMHQRKNEITGLESDPDEKTLTYATAAKRRLVKIHRLCIIKAFYRFKKKFSVVEQNSKLKNAIEKNT